VIIAFTLCFQNPLSPLRMGIREPFDYYQMANAYIGSLLDFDRSILRHPERFAEIKRQLDAGGALRGTDGLSIHQSGTLNADEHNWPRNVQCKRANHISVNLRIPQAGGDWVQKRT
jgi:hypothetical protein